MKCLKYLDPFYWFLRIVLSFFLTVDLSPEDEGFVSDNNWKHRKILWLNVPAAFMVWNGIADVEVIMLAILSAALVAPVMLLGSAWFNISFGGIPARLIDIAMQITFCMFLAFTLSFTTMIVMIMYITPPIIWPVLWTIFLCAIISCIQYDTTDGLKAGLDEAVLNHSRAALLHCRKQGIDPEKKEEQEEEK